MGIQQRLNELVQQVGSITPTSKTGSSYLKHEAARRDRLIAIESALLSEGYSQAEINSLNLGITTEMRRQYNTLGSYWDRAVQKETFERSVQQGKSQDFVEQSVSVYNPVYASPSAAVRDPRSVGYTEIGGTYNIPFQTRLIVTEGKYKGMEITQIPKELRKTVKVEAVQGPGEYILGYTEKLSKPTGEEKAGDIIGGYRKQTIKVSDLPKGSTVAGIPVDEIASAALEPTPSALGTAARRVVYQDQLKKYQQSIPTTKAEILQHIFKKQGRVYEISDRPEAMLTVMPTEGIADKYPRGIITQRTGFESQLGTGVPKWYAVGIPGKLYTFGKNKVKNIKKNIQREKEVGILSPGISSTFGYFQDKEKTVSFKEGFWQPNVKKYVTPRFERAEADLKGIGDIFYSRGFFTKSLADPSSKFTKMELERQEAESKYKKPSNIFNYTPNNLVIHDTLKGIESFKKFSKGIVNDFWGISTGMAARGTKFVRYTIEKPGEAGAWMLGGYAALKFAGWAGGAITKEVTELGIGGGIVGYEALTAPKGQAARAAIETAGVLGLIALSSKSVHAKGQKGDSKLMSILKRNKDVGKIIEDARKPTGIHGKAVKAAVIRDRPIPGLEIIEARGIETGSQKGMVYAKEPSKGSDFKGIQKITPKEVFKPVTKKGNVEFEDLGIEVANILKPEPVIKIKKPKSLILDLPTYIHPKTIVEYAKVQPITKGGTIENVLISRPKVEPGTILPTKLNLGKATILRTDQPLTFGYERKMLPTKSYGKMFPEISKVRKGYYMGWDIDTFFIGKKSYSTMRQGKTLILAERLKGQKVKYRILEGDKLVNEFIEPYKEQQPLFKSNEITRTIKESGYDIGVKSGYRKYYNKYVKDLISKGVRKIGEDEAFLIFKKGKKTIKLKRPYKDVEYSDLRKISKSFESRATASKTYMKDNKVLQESFVGKAQSRLKQIDIAKPEERITSFGKNLEIRELIPTHIIYSLQPSYKPNIKQYSILKGEGTGLEAVTRYIKRSPLEQQRTNKFYSNSRYIIKELEKGQAAKEFPEQLSYIETKKQKRPSVLIKMLKSKRGEYRGIDRSLILEQKKRAIIETQMPKIEPPKMEQARPIFSLRELEKVTKAAKEGIKAEPLLKPFARAKTENIARARPRIEPMSIARPRIEPMSIARPRIETRAMNEIRALNESRAITRTMQRQQTISKQSVVQQTATISKGRSFIRQGIPVRTPEPPPPVALPRFSRSQFFGGKQDRDFGYFYREFKLKPIKLKKGGLI